MADLSEHYRKCSLFYLSSNELICFLLSFWSVSCPTPWDTGETVLELMTCSLFISGSKARVCSGFCSCAGRWRPSALCCLWRYDATPPSWEVELPCSWSHVCSWLCDGGVPQEKWQVCQLPALSLWGAVGTTGRKPHRWLTIEWLIIANGKNITPS